MTIGGTVFVRGHPWSARSTGASWSTNWCTPVSGRTGPLASAAIWPDTWEVCCAGSATELLSGPTPTRRRPGVAGTGTSSDPV